MERLSQGSPASKELFTLWKETWKNGEDLDAFADNQYALALVALRATDLKKIEFILHCYLTNFDKFTPEESFIYRDKMNAASFDIDNEETVQKMIDCGSVLTTLLSRYSEGGSKLLNERNKEHTRIIEKRDRRSLYVEGRTAIEKNEHKKQKKQKLLKFFDYCDRKYTPTSAEITDFPFNLIFDPEKITPLRREFNEYATLWLGPSSRRLYDPQYGEHVVQLPEDSEIRPNYVQRIFADSAGREFLVGRAFETLLAQFPDLSMDAVKELSQIIEETKNTLKKDARTLVSPRGDVLVVQDPELAQKYGITKVSFFPDSSVVDLRVQVTYRDTTTFVCKLDTDFSLRDGAQKHALDISMNTSLLLHHIVLNHLKEILCGMEAGGGGQGKTADATQDHPDIRVRRPHMRKLPSGKSFTTEQAMLAQKEYGVNLLMYNEARGLTKTEGQFTFVSEGSVDFQEAKKLPPMVSSVGRVCSFETFFEKK
jgi:hypothetical protein